MCRYYSECTKSYEKNKMIYSTSVAVQNPLLISPAMEYTKRKPSIKQNI